MLHDPRETSGHRRNEYFIGARTGSHFVPNRAHKPTKLL